MLNRKIYILVMFYDYYEYEVKMIDVIKETAKIKRFAQQMNINVDEAINFYELQREKNRKNAYNRAVEFVFNEKENARYPGA